MKTATHEDSDGAGYCRGFGTTIGEEHHQDCELPHDEIMASTPIENCQRLADIACELDALKNQLNSAAANSET